MKYMTIILALLLTATVAFPADRKVDVDASRSKAKIELFGIDFSKSRRTTGVSVGDSKSKVGKLGVVKRGDKTQLEFANKNFRIRF
jgi:hypothetical protein